MTGPILPGESVATIRALPSPAATGAMLPFEAIFGHLCYLRCYVWDAEPSDATLTVWASEMVNDVQNTDQVEQWVDCWKSELCE